jgi:hypothetical protein
MIETPPPVSARLRRSGSRHERGCNRNGGAGVYTSAMRILLLSACCMLSLAAADDPKEIVRRALQRNAHNDEIARQYTYLQREDVRMLDGEGNIKHRDQKTVDITLLDGSPYRRLVSRDGKPLPPDEEKKERELLRKNIEDRRKETPEQRKLRIADWDKKRNRDRENLKEVPDAFDFHLVGEEQFEGVSVWIIEGTPRPGFQPKSKDAGYFPKVKGRIWVAKTDYTPVKIEAETLDTISIGAFLLRLAKGGRIDVEFTRVNDEVWMFKHVGIVASARLLLIKGFHYHADYFFSDFKKFSAESRLLDSGQ